MEPAASPKALFSSIILKALATSSNSGCFLVLYTNCFIELGLLLLFKLKTEYMLSTSVVLLFHVCE